MKLFLALCASALLWTAPSSYAQQVLRVGANPVAPPIAFHDKASNTFRGVAVELIAAIAKDAGFEVQYTPVASPDAIAALNANKIDIIASNMRVTPERKALVDFSQSYHTGGDGLVVPAADTKDYKTIGDLKGMAIGAQKGSPQLAEMQQAGIFSDVKSFDSFADVMRAVGKGEIAAGMIGATVVRYEQRLGNFTDVRLVASYRPPGEVPGIAYAVRKSDGDLLSKINTSLAKLQADGTVNKIKANYGL